VGLLADGGRRVRADKEHHEHPLCAGDGVVGWEGGEAAKCEAVVHVMWGGGGGTTDKSILTYHCIPGDAVVGPSSWC
jgi:hypothetical protein